MGQLFTKELVQAISQLRLRAKQVPAGGRSAEHRSLEKGSGMEFRDFRAYVPGDDLRRADWNLYRRSGRLFLRLFEESQDLPVYILLDISDSMFFEAPPRADAARIMAAAIAAISLNQHDRVGIFPFGSDLVTPLKPTSGKRNIQRVFDYLERMKPGGPTDLVKVIKQFGAMRLRRGLTVIISDYFDPRGIEETINSLGSLRHRLLLVQVKRETDENPALNGEVTLVDCESGRSVDLTINSPALERYRRSYREFLDRLLRFTSRRRAGHLMLDADRPVFDQLREFFPDGILST